MLAPSTKADTDPMGPGPSAESVPTAQIKVEACQLIGRVWQNCEMCNDHEVQGGPQKPVIKFINGLSLSQWPTGLNFWGLYT